ncbi:MAG: hypothetical protein WC162_04945 [Sphaerochaetaceae bacterium]|nr:hypothetical protein [Sphaerochaetaceae bacterium]
MAEKGGFGSGLLKALILAVLSFAVLFFLFPNISDQNFGYSYKNGDLGIRNRLTNEVVQGMRDSGASQVEIDAIIEKIKENSEITVNKLMEVIDSLNLKDTGNQVLSNIFKLGD